MQTSKPTRPASPEAIRAADAAPKKKPTNYPEPFASRVAGREKRPLGDVFGLSNFGVNLTRLSPGAISALRHAHTRCQDGEPFWHTESRMGAPPLKCS